MTIKSQSQSIETVPAIPDKNTSQVLDSSPSSSTGIHDSEHDDDSGTTIPRPRALVYDTEDSDAEGAGGEHESDIESMRSPSPFLAESDDDELSLQIARKARAAFAEATTKGSSASQPPAQNGASKSVQPTDKNAMQTPAKVDAQAFDWMPINQQPPVSTPNQAQQAPKRRISEGREAIPQSPFSATYKRPKTAAARLAATPKLKSTSGCKHNICLGLDKCLVPSSPAV